MEAFVVCGTIAKNRAWVLPRWCGALDAQTVRPDAAFVLVNDSGDASLATLDACGRLMRNVELHVDTFNTGDLGHDRVSPRYSTANLALLRNEWVRRCLERWPQLTHLWSVDSDVLPDPDVLEKLLAADKAVIAAVVRNSTSEVFNFWMSNDNGEPRRQGIEALLVERRDKPFEATMTGAAVLIRRDVLDAGVRYADHKNGEDVAWSMAATKAGFSLYVHPLARTRHLQKDGSEWR